MKHLTINIPEQELEILKAYGKQKNRNQTDVLREFIRNLKRKIKHDTGN